MRASIFKEIIQMAFDSLKTHKLRSFLTLLGITIGVMTVVGMVSIIQGLNKSFLQELESVGSDIIVVSKFEPGIQTGELSEERRQRKDLTFDDAMALERECSLVKAVAVDITADISEDFTIKYRDRKSQGALIIGMNEGFPQVLSVYLPQKGRFLTQTDILHRTPVCVLGHDLAETLFPHTHALQKEIRIGGKKFTVVGVLQKRGQIFGQSQDNFVGLPITTFIKYFPYDKSNLEIIAAPREHADIPEAMDQIIHVLRKRRKVPFGKTNDFAVYTQETFVDLYNQLTGAAYLVMIAISSIGLVVGGIGVMNIMLVSVKERTREIGIRKAIGARSSDILKQFLMESIFLTGTGGTLGILLGFGIAFTVKSATSLPASVTTWSVIAAFLVSLIVGLFSGILPAHRAAQLDPIISLRYE